MNASDHDSSERREIEDLLPWYAAGTLSRRDAQRVQDALAHDPELTHRYDLVREELANTIQVNETLGTPSARAMKELFAKIDAEPAHLRVARAALAERLAAFLASLSPRTLAFSASAAAFVILLQTGLIGGVMLNQQAAGGYETASAPSGTTSDGAFALIRFTSDATAADIAKFLESNKIAITGGPSAGGLYRIRIATTGLPRPELANILKRLEEDKVVNFLAPTE
jgi:anti-sigma factor RsiW